MDYYGEKPFPKRFSIDDKVVTKHPVLNMPWTHVVTARNIANEATLSKNRFSWSVICWPGFHGPPGLQTDRFEFVRIFQIFVGPGPGLGPGLGPGPNRSDLDQPV